MRAPTHITGPDNTLCRKGDEIPEAWFDDLPDLRSHLDALGSVDDSVAEATSAVKASATISRRRSSEGGDQ